MTMPCSNATYGFGKMLDRGVQPVFVAIEVDRVGRACAARFIERANVAARAKRPLAGAPDGDRFDGLVRFPVRKPVPHRDAHRVRQRVERFGPVERDKAKRASPLEKDILLFACRAHCRNISRAMITRMISFVPSRIWWTRRSRTCRSAGKSFR